jgi:uncharacterized protein
MKLFSIAALAAALAVGVAFAGIGRPGAAHGSPAPSGRTVTVTGSATVRGAPDTAVFSFGVDSDGATASAATTSNSEQMNRVIAALVNAGVARADIKTQDVSVYAQRNDSGSIDGYNASNSVSVTVRRLAKAGATVDAAVAAGANETSGPQFERSGGGLYQQALRNAFADARAKAETLATEAGASLGEARKIDEGGQPEQPVPLMFAADKAAGTPIEPGTQQVQASVTVTFSLS